ncbi:hypothetical protein GGU11DRAFT_832545 [Lentinula aff. detonsa]|nr:hypothetical protein GGU11DRAFT_832545 [Lentinula aff. detonsa]
MATVHDYMRVKFGAGFRIQEVITGFETPWLYLSNIPPNVRINDILHFLSKHGTVQDVRMGTSGRGETPEVRARFSSHIEAQNANIVLNGTRQWDSIISTQLPVNTAHAHVNYSSSIRFVTSSDSAVYRGVANSFAEVQSRLEVVRTLWDLSVQYFAQGSCTILTWCNNSGYSSSN